MIKEKIRNLNLYELNDLSREIQERINGLFDVDLGENNDNLMKEFEELNYEYDIVFQEITRRMCWTEKDFQKMRRDYNKLNGINNCMFMFTRLLNNVYTGNWDNSLEYTASISNSFIPRIMILNNIDPNVFPILFLLVRSITDKEYGLVVYVNREDIASIIGKSVRTVRRTIDLLVKNKVLKRIERQYYKINASVLFNNPDKEKNSNEFFNPEFDEYFYDKNGEKLILEELDNKPLTLESYSELIELNYWK